MLVGTIDAIGIGTVIVTVEEKIDGIETDIRIQETVIEETEIDDDDASCIPIFNTFAFCMIEDDFPHQTSSASFGQKSAGLKCPGGSFYQLKP